MLQEGEPGLRVPQARRGAVEWQHQFTPFLHGPSQDISEGRRRKAPAGSMAGWPSRSRTAPSLTELGASANACGLLPKTCRVLSPQRPQQTCSLSESQGRPFPHWKGRRDSGGTGTPWSTCITHNVSGMEPQPGEPRGGHHRRRPKSLWLEEGQRATGQAPPRLPSTVPGRPPGVGLQARPELAGDSPSLDHRGHQPCLLPCPASRGRAAAPLRLQSSENSFEGKATSLGPSLVT